MVLPSIRSFEELSMINLSKEKNIVKSTSISFIQTSRSLEKPSKFISKHRLKKLNNKNVRNYEYPIAS